MKNFTKTITNKTLFKTTRWLIMALMLLVGTSSAWGANTVAGGHIYFDNTTTKWEDNCIQFVIGHSGFSRTYTMSKITNTNLYYVNLSSSTYHDWGDATYYAVIGTNSKWGDGEWGSSNLTNATHYTAAYTTKYDMDADNKRYIVTPSSKSNGTDISIVYQGTNASSIQEPQTVNIFTNGSSSASGGTVKMTGYYMDSDNAVNSSASTSTGASITFNATPTTSMELLATAKTGYEFDGWYTTASGGTALSTSTTYTYTVPNSTKTIYARFTQSCTTPTFTIDGLTSICEEGEYTYEIKNAVNPNATYEWTNGLLDNNNTYTGTSYTFTAGTGTKIGTISVVATDATCTYDQSIYVSQIAKVTTAGTITGTSTIEVGQTSQLSVDGASTGTASWSSNSEDVATVDENGLVTAKSTGTATITYTVEPSLTGCGSTQSTPYTITVIEACEAPIVTIKNVEQLSCSSLKVTYNVTSNNGQSCGYPTGNANKIRIFDSQANAEGTTLFIGSLLHTAAPINEDEEVTIPSNYMWTQPGGTYYVRVGAENSQGWGWSNIMEVTIPTNETLTNVTINPVDAVCKGQSTTLTLNNYSIGDIQWQKKVGDVWTNIAGATAVSYTTEALNAEMQYRIVLTDNNCNVHIQPITVSVTEPPVITSITGDDNVTIGDNVSLTANITGVYEEIEWAVEGVNSSEITTNGTSCSFVATDITTYVATATVKRASCTVSKSHNIVVNDENCTPVASDDIKITFKTPSNNGKTGQYWGIGSLYYKKDNGASYTEVKLYENDNCQGGEQTSQEVTISNLQNNATVYFKACFDYGTYTATTKKLTLTKGNKYIIGIISDQNPSSTNSTNKTSEVGIEVTSEVSLTRDPDITAPAVKMVSAEYNENTSQVDVVAAIYKRGCDNVEWGFQYSEDGTTWSNKIYPNSHTATAVGEVTHSFSIDGGEGNTYYIRAYAKNSNSEVTSANTKSVEIPSSIINSATISLVDSEGDPSDDTEVCPQSTVYLKVSYVGGDFTDFVAEENFPGTDLELVNHDKTNNDAIFSFTATAAGTANITISNKSGSTVTTADGVSITLIDVQVVTTPIIYLEKNTICENQNTNVVVNSPIVGFVYSLKNGSVGDPITYESGDLKFEVNKEGSYTVQVQETVCGTTAISAPVDLRVIASDVKITLTTDVNTINPWQPLTLTVKAPSGYDYDLKGLDGTVYTKSGDVYTIKFPRPDSWGVGNSASKSEPKTFTAGIKAGEEPSCSTTTKEIQLVDTEEVCLAPGN